MAFKVGDLVQLKSGGPKMTVSRLVENSEENIRIGDFEFSFRMKSGNAGDVRCQWFEEEKLKEATFRSESLKEAT